MDILLLFDNFVIIWFKWTTPDFLTYKRLCRKHPLTTCFQGQAPDWHSTCLSCIGSSCRSLSQAIQKLFQAVIRNYKSIIKKEKVKGFKKCKEKKSLGDTPGPKSWRSLKLNLADFLFLGQKDLSSEFQRKLGQVPPISARQLLVSVVYDLR